MEIIRILVISAMLSTVIACSEENKAYNNNEDEISNIGRQVSELPVLDDINLDEQVQPPAVDPVQETTPVDEPTLQEPILSGIVENLAVLDIAASTDDGNIPENSRDGSLNTRWSAFGEGEWISFDLGETIKLRELQMAFYMGDIRQAFFHIEVSDDNTNWVPVAENLSSAGDSLNLQAFAVADPQEGRYLRIVGMGNSDSLWNSYTEILILGEKYVTP